MKTCPFSSGCCKRISLQGHRSIPLLWAFTGIAVAHLFICFGLPWWLSGRESTAKAGDSGSILGLRGSPGEGNGNPVQYSCLGNPRDRGAWWATVSMGTQKGQIKLSNLTSATTMYLFIFLSAGFSLLRPGFL